MSMFISPLEVSRSHPLRQSWKKIHGFDLREINIFRTVCVISFVSLLCLVTLVFTKIIPPLGDGWLSNVVSFGLLAGIFYGGMFGCANPRSFDSSLLQCLEHIELKLEDLHSKSWPDLQKRAHEKLLYLATRVIQTEQTFPGNPYQPNRVTAIKEFERVFDLCTRFGLIEAKNYIAYFSS
ncbi:hypothetical protein A3C09_00570 [Candidatus Uhrbacteria bacterium RIFCSPHIGHO2_02_FULL_47_44]|nr:MAG: hypothetical protein A3C09_00570 [Candidatus Uhrbacteria bacterium RIFCSPHIGHO2_02_FULL_47_44]